MTAVDLNAVVRHCLKLLQSVLSANIKVEAHLGEDELLVQAEENQLRQVIVNLCFNARDAMPSGGTLRVRTERGLAADGEKGRKGEGERNPDMGVPFSSELLPVSPSPLLPFSPSSSAAARIIIEDTGDGMDESVLAHIFDPFFSTKEHGTGLGLTMVRQIIESFGGQVKASSQPQQGTRMEVILKSSN